MGIKIDLPDNRQRYIQLGLEQKTQGAFEAAFTFFEKAFELQASHDVQVEMIDCLLQMDTPDSYARAEKDILENRRIMMQSENGAMLFFQVLLRTHNFYQLKAFILNPPLPLAEEVLQASFEQLIGAEAAYKLTSTSEIQATQKALVYLGDKSLKEQQRVIELGEHLPTDLFVESVIEQLKNPFLNQLTRVDLFDKLVNMNVDQEIECLNYQGKVQKINPARSQTLRHDQTTLLIEQILKENMTNADLTMQQMILEEAHLQSLYLYPFTKAIIGDVNKWAVGYLKTYQISSSKNVATGENEEEIKKAQGLQALIREKLLKSVEF